MPRLSIYVPAKWKPASNTIEDAAGAFELREALFFFAKFAQMATMPQSWDQSGEPGVA
jgi:hypothetical protein